MGATLPSAGFELLSEMVHLDMADANFSGQIPIGVARLSKLVHLSAGAGAGGPSSRLVLKEPSFETLVANLGNLRELRLRGVDISIGGRETWSVALARSTPDLQILSLSSCGLSGPIHGSFSRLRSLAEISLPGNRIAGKVPEFFAGFSSLSTLDLRDNDFEGQFPAEVFRLKNLKVLLVSGNSRLSGHLESFPVENRLEMLDLKDTNFSDALPASIVNLKSLRFLTLSTGGTSKHLHFIGKLPSLGTLMLQGSSSGLGKAQFSWIGDLTHLTSLLIDNYNFSEPIPSWIGNLTELMSLRLSMCSLYGPIPYWIGNLTQLSSIDFTGNYLTGKIPRSLFTLPKLQSLSLSSNQLSGHLDAIDNPLSSLLSNVNLVDNNNGGSIPQSYTQLPSLEALYLDSNKLTGTVNLRSFWRLKNLYALSLSNNMLTVIDEEDDPLLSSLPHIKILELASCNLRKLPRTLRFLDGIETLDLSNNHIHGAIPGWLWETRTGCMSYLNLSHNIFNRLQGIIPIPTVKVGCELMSLKPSAILHYSNNYFNAIPPNFGDYLKDMTYIDFSNNLLNGHIPTSVCSARDLEILDLSYNYFSRMIPACLTQNNLRVLKLRGNRVHGELPDNIPAGCMLQTIDLSRNYITGKLPRSLSNCQELELLDVGNNQITDLFPSWMGVLPKLKVLVLRSNRLFGMITDLQENEQIMGYFSSLQILCLASNNFSGHLPEGWFNELKSMMSDDNEEGQVVGHQMNTSQGFYRDTVTITFKGLDIIFTKILTTFKAIDFSNNSFYGPIPASIGRLSSLHGINMSHNNFTEQIPSQFGNLTCLESLDLSWNHFSGEIPEELTSLTSLAWLNLSYNNLTGRIPQGNQFLSFPNSSFEGNLGLCGSQVSKQCDNSGSGSATQRASDHHESNSLWQDRVDTILLFTFVGLGFGVGFALAMMFNRFCHIEGWVCKHYGTHT
ncbi:hypothetical protein SORBI_3003G059100 [Sorghum bicolor]|uniref:Leucine-rich repeat-containing N-terminal plant-type domain-containing protein n=1 Tax=Sorghum bicolor TaxID=4558 RepID=A0A1B6Q1J8_SORBI|nr:hypothetical protein SORBI_3003G059100 [Sorghum bicolor]